jgi:ABC-type uncharacterized transport system permease subunit
MKEQLRFIMTAICFAWCRRSESFHVPGQMMMGEILPACGQRLRYAEADPLN